jgi:hypothetical protein
LLKSKKANSVRQSVTPVGGCDPTGFAFFGLSRASGIGGGADRDRTGDPLLAKQVLSQLSYSPVHGFADEEFHLRDRLHDQRRCTATT